MGQGPNGTGRELGRDILCIMVPVIFGHNENLTMLAGDRKHEGRLGAAGTGQFCIAICAKFGYDLTVLAVD
jgi:hypothetical protein